MTPENQDIAERDEDVQGQATESGAPMKEGSGQGSADHTPNEDSPPLSATSEHADEDQGGVTVPSS